MIRIISKGLGLYLLCFLLLVIGQRWLLYRPTVLTDESFAYEVSRLSGAPTVLSGFNALVFEPPKRYTHETAILFHGNAGSNLDRAYLAQDVVAQGYRLVIAEYPGYGSRPGVINQESWVKDARHLFATLQEKYPEDVFTVIGESVGSGVAVQLAATAESPPTNLVLITPFDSLAQTAQRRIPAFPVASLVFDKFDSMATISGYKGNISILVAENDELVGAAAGVSLFEAAQKRGPALLVSIPNAEHNTWWSKTTAKNWRQLLRPSDSHFPVQK